MSCTYSHRRNGSRQLRPENCANVRSVIARRIYSPRLAWSRAETEIVRDFSTSVEMTKPAHEILFWFSIDDIGEVYHWPFGGRRGRTKTGGAQDYVGATGRTWYSSADRVYARGFWRAALFAIFGDRRRETGGAHVCRSCHACAREERDVHAE